jgi:hypothetical protein
LKRFKMSARRQYYRNLLQYPSCMLPSPGASCIHNGLISNCFLRRLGSFWDNNQEIYA